MLHYYKLAIRNIKKDKVFTIINIAGLAVGITCFITLSLFIIDELSFDKFNKNAHNIYRLGVKTVLGNHQDVNSKTSGNMGPVLVENFPEVKTYTRMGYNGQRTYKIGNNSFTTGDVYSADSTFFDVFTLEFISGSPSTALNKPNSLVLTESVAKSYFGNEEALGKTIPANNGHSYIVTAVIKDFPQNSHFRTGMLESMITFDVSENWLDLWFTTYVVLQEGIDPEVFEKKLQQIVPTYVGPEAEAVLGYPLTDFLKNGNYYGFFLQPLTSIYLYSQRDYEIDLNTEWGNIKTSDISYVYIFSAVAMFILLLAIINFMNLTTAQSERRSKEVGIRKTLGSNKRRLIFQFISEAVMLTFISVLISLALLEAVLPLFNSLANKNLHMDIFTSLYTIPVITGFTLIVGTLAGSYPALYLSSFDPIQVLKKGNSNRNRKSILRSTLVVLQFSVSITLLIATIIINDQLSFIQNKNLGFKKEHLISINNANVIINSVDAFKQELKKNPGIISVTNCSRMFQSGVPGSGYLFEENKVKDPLLVQFLNADYDFLNTYNIKLKSGRYFSKDYTTDSMSVLINETTARLSGIADPVGTEMIDLDARRRGKRYTIIGVIKNFNYESLHREIRPLVLHLGLPLQFSSTLTIRIGNNNIKETIKYINKTWQKYAGDEPIFYDFVEQNLMRLYESEQRTSIIAGVFSSLAIFIACLGLFGLAAFVTEQRTKEIGIRKVLGASITEITMLLSKEFAIWVLLANLISWPVAYFIMKGWLENFAFKVKIDLSVFIIAGIAALVIALLTVGIHTVKAARSNPVNSLKYE